MKYLYFKAIGAIDTKLLDTFLQSLPFSVPHKLITEDNYPISAYESRRKQYFARKIIDALSLNLPSDCEKLIGITDIDLCTPVLTFVFGEAQLGGSVAVVSINRLKQEFYSLPINNALLIERLSKVCIHELGHCYGLVHCHNSRCVMHLSNNIVSIDDKQRKFCMKCGEFFNKKMRKEHHG